MARAKRVFNFTTPRVQFPQALKYYAVEAGEGQT